VSKLAVFVDHDIIVRHFVLNGVLRALEDEHDVVWIFPEKHRRVTGDPATLPIGRHRTVPISESRLHGYRRLYHASVLRMLRGTRDQRAIFGFWHETLGRRAFWTSWALSWPGTHDLYHRRMVARIGPATELDALLDDEKPDVIVHPTVLEGLFVSDLVRWGRRRGVPTVFLMNSWDNPAVKAMTVGVPDRLVVWGEHSRLVAHERLRMPLEHVVVFGAAQFEVYRTPPRETREAYRARIGIPVDHQVLLYAGSSKGLDETAHLVALDEAIEAGQLPRCTVLYRPHPWRARLASEADFLSRQWRHVLMAPDMVTYYRQHRAGEASMFLADYAETHVTLSAVDAVVSPLSTILLEAGLHGTPILAYLPDEDMTQNIAMFSMAKTVHFRDFFERVDCLLCERPDDLVSDCARLLRMAARPDTAERLRAQCSFFVDTRGRSYADRLDALIRELAGTGAATSVSR
jgi:hypothetical protein